MTEKRFYEFMKPILEVLSDKEKKENQGLRKEIYRFLALSPEEVEARFSDSGQKIVDNRIGWALTYLTKSKLVQRVSRGTYQITEAGIDFNQAHKNFTQVDLPKTDEIKAFIGESDMDQEAKNIEVSIGTPEETIDLEFDKMNKLLVDNLLEQLKATDPFYFEKITVDLILAMGYGGSKQEIQQVTQKVGDGGIDGIINEDRLGLDVIYLQAKRWESNVGRPEIQAFVGALMGKHASKGIFITTSRFSKEAVVYAENLPSKVILIDGEKLASLMIEFNVGVEIEKIYEIKTINNDYFSDDYI